MIILVCVCFCVLQKEPGDFLQNSRYCEFLLALYWESLTSLTYVPLPQELQKTLQNLLLVLIKLVGVGENKMCFLQT